MDVERSAADLRLQNMSRLLLFTRGNDRDPFSYRGLVSAEPGSPKDQSPVSLAWSVGALPQERLTQDDDDASPNDSANYAPSEKDERNRVLREIRARRGQKAFRDSLVKQFDGRCAICGCDVLSVLEAAQVRPYRGPNDNHEEWDLAAFRFAYTLRSRFARN